VVTQETEEKPTTIKSSLINNEIESNK